MSTRAVEFGFVAALEREVAGLIRSGSAAQGAAEVATQVQIAGGSRKVYCNERRALICAGTGVERAYVAARALIEKCSPRVIVSIGFAGSCVPRLRPGSIVVPATLFEPKTGKSFDCAFGSGRLVTLDRVAGRALKQEAFTRFGALAVDMEAAGVAAAASECGREFAAIKVISDGEEEDLEFLSSFVTPEGFATGRFIAHIALRPGLWPSVSALGRNSKLAAKALASAVEDCTNDWRAFSSRHRNAAAQV